MSQPVVFISYSHKDENEKEELLTHLKVLDSHFDPWSDDRIGGGGDWAKEIDEAMEQASIAIMLVSANFLTSKFIRNKEIPKLLELREQDGLLVFPILAKDCAWEDVAWLAKINMRPRNGKPVWGESKNVDGYLAKITREIADYLKTDNKNSERDKIVSPTSGQPDLDERASSFPDECTSDSFPFVNQKRIINELVPKKPDKDSYPYRIISAPVHFGKTWLLCKVANILQERGSKVIYVDFSDILKIEEIAFKIAECINNIDYAIHGGQHYAHTLGVEISKNNNIVGKKIYLLIDSFNPGKLRERLWDSLFGEFIPVLHSTLENNNISLRLIVAGRSLDTPTPSSSGGRSYIKPNARIMPFDIKIIKETVKSRLPHLDPSVVTVVSHLLFHYTGGHPGCMANILGNYEEAIKYHHTPYQIYEYFDLKRDWISEVVGIEVDAIKRGIKYERSLDELSPLRYLSSELLNHLLLSKRFSARVRADMLDDGLGNREIFDGDALANKIIQTNLYGGNASFLFDGIARRLFMLSRSVRSPEALKEACQRAQNVCKVLLEDKSTRAPGLWAVEFLFQALQRHVVDIDFMGRNHQTRALTNQFFQTDIPELHQVLETNHDLSSIKKMIKAALKDDWEFEHTVNFYLGGEKYGNDPYGKLNIIFEE